MEYFTSSEFFTNFVSSADLYLNSVKDYLSVNENLKYLAVILMILSLILFLCFIIILYIRNIIRFVKSDDSGSSSTEDSTEPDDEFLEFFNLDEQTGLENELQKEYDLALAEQEQKENQQNLIQQEYLEEEKLKEDKQKDKKENKRKKSTSKIELKLDWEYGKNPSTQIDKAPDIEKISLTYKQNRQELKSLIGLIIDMLSRNVDDLKIGQTVNYKTTGAYDEGEILKLIDSVKLFINLCSENKFAPILTDDLPPQDLSIYHLANGDASLALVLLENLINYHVENAGSNISEDHSAYMYSQASQYACCFGTLAEINDIMLATSAYELAIELQSTNVTAWSRLGDVYQKTNSYNKTMWAYENVINYADSEINIAEISNANHHMSELLYAQGNSLEAARLYNSSKQYYDSLGINRRLDRQEIEAINIIEESHEKALPEIINKILGRANEK